MMKSANSLIILNYYKTYTTKEKEFIELRQLWRSNSKVNEIEVRE